VIVHSTDDLNPLSPSEVFGAMVGRFISDIARGASFVRQRSMMLSIEDDRDSLARNRDRLDEETATYIEGLVNLAHDHGVDALRGLGLMDLELVRIATVSLNREKPPAPVPADRHPLDTFTDERLVDALYELLHALRSWDWLAATESPYENSPEETGALVLDRVAKVMAAIERREEARA